MQGRVDDAQRRRPARRGHRQAWSRGDDGVEVGPRHLVAVPGDQRAIQGPGRDLRQRSQAGDRRLDLRVDRRHDLCPVAKVELVAVVRGRVMARRDHDARRGRQVLDSERQQRRRVRARQQVNTDARPGEHGRCLVGEVGRPVPRVASDDHRHPGSVSGRGSARRPVSARLPGGTGRPGSRGPVFVQPAGQRRGRRPDHGPVHPVRTRPDLAAQPGRAELEAAGKPVGELGQCDPARLAPLLAGGEQRPQLGPVAGIRILADPGLHLGAQTGRDHGQSPAMGPRGPATGPRGPGMSRRAPGTRTRLRQTQTRLIWM